MRGDCWVMVVMREAVGVDLQDGFTGLGIWWEWRGGV